LKKFFFWPKFQERSNFWEGRGGWTTLGEKRGGKKIITKKNRRERRGGKKIAKKTYQKGKYFYLFKILI